MNKKKLTFVTIGSGNVATHFSVRLKKEGYQPLQIFSKTKKNAITLSNILSCNYTTQSSEINDNADFYLLAISDDSIPEIIKNKKLKNKLLIHTAGSINAKIFSSVTTQYGVIYPLQTISKDKKINFNHLPLFIESSDKKTLTIIRKIAKSLSGNVHYLNSEKRILLHISAVFACNFTNYNYTIAADLVKKAGLPFSILHPLLIETAHKTLIINPREAQTGPAIRNDKKTISKHLKELKNYPDIAKMYSFVTNSIIKYHRVE